MFSPSFKFDRQAPQSPMSCWEASVVVRERRGSEPPGALGGLRVRIRRHSSRACPGEAVT